MTFLAFLWKTTDGIRTEMLLNTLKRIVSNLHKLLSQRRSGNTLFRLLTQSICVKLTFLDSDWSTIHAKCHNLCRNSIIKPRSVNNMRKNSLFLTEWSVGDINTSRDIIQFTIHAQCHNLCRNSIIKPRSVNNMRKNSLFLTEWSVGDINTSRAIIQC